MELAELFPASSHVPSARDVSVMADKPLCECGRTRLSVYNTDGICGACTQAQADYRFAMLQSGKLPRQRILDVLEKATEPMRASQIAKKAIVGDNETYRLVRDLFRRKQIQATSDGMATLYTIGAPA